MQRLKRLLKWLVLILVVAVAGTAAWLLWTRNQAPQTTSLTQVVTVERGNLVATISPTGEVYAPRQAELSFDVNKIELIELNVAAGQQVKAGDVLARIETETLERAVTQAEADLTVAQDNLEKAENPYSELDLVQAKLAVDQAATALAEARENLAAAMEPSACFYKSVIDLEYDYSWYYDNYHQVAQQYEAGEVSREEMNRAQENLQWAEERLNEAVQCPPGPEDVAVCEGDYIWYQGRYAEMGERYKAGEISQEQLFTLWDHLQAAKKRLEQARQATSELDRAQNQGVTQAEYNLQKAQASLAEIQAGPDPDEVEVAQAKVTSAQAALEDAQAALEAATLVAPFDGTVISTGAEVGDLVSSTTIVATLADLSNLRVRAFVDETDISQVEISQEVEITFDAFPGQKFQGQVLEVPLQGTLSQNVLTYEVPVSLEGAEGVSVKPGMTANLKFVVGRRENVLLVPALAVQQGEEGNVVMVQDSPQEPAVQTPVEVGLSDGLYVEVLRGLNEGDQVVIEYQPVEEGQPGFRGGIFPGGGGSTEERRE